MAARFPRSRRPPYLSYSLRLACLCLVLQILAKTMIQGLKTVIWCCSYYGQPKSSQEAATAAVAATAGGIVPPQVVRGRTEGKTRKRGPTAHTHTRVISFSFFHFLRAVLVCLFGVDTAYHLRQREAFFADGALVCAGKKIKT